MPKDDPLDQGYADQVRQQMAGRTLWLNADNFEEMVSASLSGLSDEHKNVLARLGLQSNSRPSEIWTIMCAAALAVVEWRMGGRVRS